MLRKQRYDKALEFLKSQTPSGVHLALEQIGPMASGDDLELQEGLKFFLHHVTQSHFADEVQAYLSLFLAAHGEEIAASKELQALCAELATAQENKWSSLNTRCQKARCFLGMLTQTQRQGEYCKADFAGLLSIREKDEDPAKEEEAEAEEEEEESPVTARCRFADPEGASGALTALSGAEVQGATVEVALLEGEEEEAYWEESNRKRKEAFENPKGKGKDGKGKKGKGKGKGKKGKHKSDD
eukprot:s4863_g5.t1